MAVSHARSVSTKNAQDSIFLLRNAYGHFVSAAFKGIEDETDMTRRRSLEDMEPDPPLTVAELAWVSALSAAQVEQLDQSLLRNTIEQWRKVAMVVGMTLNEMSEALPNLPDVFLSQRVRVLVDRGFMEAQGDLGRMRFSEVRRRGG